MVGVGRDLCGSSSPTPLPKQGHLQQAAPDLVQAVLEYLQRGRLHNLTGQPVPVLRHPQRVWGLQCSMRSQPQRDPPQPFRGQAGTGKRGAGPHRKYISLCGDGVIFVQLLVCACSACAWMCGTTCACARNVCVCVCSTCVCVIQIRQHRVCSVYVLPVCACNIHG